METPTKHKTESGLSGCGVVIGITAITVIVLVGFSFWVMNAPAVPLSKLARLHPGMSKADVQHLLGKPNSQVTHDDGSELWTYTRMTWAILYIQFNEQGELTSFDHDE